MLLRGTLWKPFLSSHASINVHHADEGDSILFDLYHLLNCSVWPQLTIKSKFANHCILCMLCLEMWMFLTHLKMTILMKVVAMVYPEGFSYQYRHPNSSIQKRKYTFIYSGIFYHKLFLLHLNKVYFQEENIPFP